MHDSEQTRVLLTSAAYVHLKQADFSKYTRNLSPASRAILLSGPAGRLSGKKDHQIWFANILCLCIYLYNHPNCEVSYISRTLPANACQGISWVLWSQIAVIWCDWFFTEGEKLILILFSSTLIMHHTDANHRFSATDTEQIWNSQQRICKIYLSTSNHVISC